MASKNRSNSQNNRRPGQNSSRSNQGRTNANQPNRTRSTSNSGNQTRSNQVRQNGASAYPEQKNTKQANTARTGSARSTMSASANTSKKNMTLRTASVDQPYTPWFSANRKEENQENKQETRRRIWNLKRKGDSAQTEQNTKAETGRNSNQNVARGKNGATTSAHSGKRPDDIKKMNHEQDENPSVAEEQMLAETTEETSTTGFRIGGRVVLTFVFLALTVFMAYLIKVQFNLQYTHYEEYSHKASEMHWQRIEDVPSRGDILDRNGNILASTTYEYTIGITPSDVLKSQEGRKEPQSEQQIAEAFHEYIGVDTEKMLEWLTQVDKPYIQVKKQVTSDQKTALNTYLNEHGIGGVKIDSVPKRYYNYGNLAAQVIGFADQRDNTLIGQYGIEAYYDDYLTGTEGYTYAEVDNYNQSALPYSAPTSIESQDGYNVQLTLDMTIQRIAENACRDAYEEYQPREGVTAIVMDPYTGEILAMVSMPDFDLNTPREKPYGLTDAEWEALADEVIVEGEGENALKLDGQSNYLMRNAWRNRCISDTYEPGSTMKAVTTAIALEEGVAHESDWFEDIPIPITEVDTISCWREKTEGNHGTETLREAFERSCNPIFVQLAQRIGIDKYYDYIHNCGFYDITGVDLPMEAKGIFHEEPTEVDMATLSFGESSTTTPLQLATVYSALVNGGSLMRPHMASRIVDSNGNIIREIEPEKVRTLFSENTSARVRSLMEDVVNEGTGAAGYVPGYYVAGKTSTSTIETGDEAGMHVISFGCYAPSYDPEIVVLVVINKPEDKEVGSSASAKVAARIVEETLEYLGTKRKLNDQEYERMLIEYNVPDVTGMTYKEARMLLMEEDFVVMDGFGTMSDDTIVEAIYYGDDETVTRDSTIVLFPRYVEKSEIPKTSVPNFEGKNVIECIRVSKQYGVNIKIEGNVKGTVVSQTPTSWVVPESEEEDPSGNEGESPGDEISGEETVEPDEATEPDEIDEGTDNDPENGESESTIKTTSPEEREPMQVPYGTVIVLTME